ncbi:MAG: transketolase, partial [Gaiellales bacterium]|nr:transketolase [Gaiellales bacterium]
DRAEIVRLAALSTGDEKHEASSYSTLDALLVLYRDVLHVDPADPAWEGRDRFILSKGHGPAAFYAVLAWRGFFPESWLPTFMAWDSPLGGHPDRLLVPGVEASTGSLGHGLPIAVGVSLALRAKGLAEQRTVVLTGDAELNEGTNWEAIMLAPHFGLSNLTLLVIDNHSSTIDHGELDQKLRLFGWDARTVDGRDHDQLRESLSWRSTDRPTAAIADIRQEGDS